MTVSVVITTRNRKDLLHGLLNSLRGSIVQPQEIIVMDDASTDSTREMLAGKHPDVRVVSSRTRNYAAHMRNWGMGIARGDYVLVCDDDNVVDSQAIGSLVALMESDPRIALAGPKMLAEDGTILWAGAEINPWTSRAVYRGCGEKDYWQYDQPCDTGHIPNCWMIRRNIFRRCGGLDEAYRMTYAEANYPAYLRSIRGEGYRVMYCPAAVVWHLVDRNGFILNPDRAYYLARNRYAYMVRWVTPLQFAVFFCVSAPALVAYYTWRTLRARRPDAMWAYWRGTLHGIWYAATGQWKNGGRP